MPKSIPITIAVHLLAGEAVPRTELAQALAASKGIAVAMMAFAANHGKVVERWRDRNRTSYICRDPVDDEVPGILIEADAGTIIYPPGKRVLRYFAATDGEITVWRSVGNSHKTYRSALIKGFSRQWRSARASGPNCFPTVRITHTMVCELVAAKARHATLDDEPWLLNLYLPASVLTALTGQPPRRGMVVPVVPATTTWLPIKGTVA